MGLTKFLNIRSCYLGVSIIIAQKDALKRPRLHE